jgi:hypothetical protein
LKVFISCSFDPIAENVIDLARSIFRMHKIDAFVSGGVESKPVSESIKGHIRGSDAFLAMLTERQSAWVQNEIGIAFDANIPIYALVQRGIKVEGILPQVTTYELFDLKNPLSVATAIAKVAAKISESKIEDEIGEIYKMFKNKRERIIYELGIHGASEQIFILLLLKDISPSFYDIYRNFHHQELERLEKELEQLE